MKNIRSEPEFVLSTMIGYKGNKIIACEGVEIDVQSDYFIGWEYCRKCPIKSKCWLKLHNIFLGGEI